MKGYMLSTTPDLEDIMSYEIISESHVEKLVKQDFQGKGWYVTESGQIGDNKMIHILKTGGYINTIGDRCSIEKFMIYDDYIHVLSEINNKYVNIYLIKIK